jgi:tetratricopeptide (TPR) repeat protein
MASRAMQFDIRYLLCVLVLLTSCACAGRATATAVPPPPPVDLTPADAMLEAGCYRCLLEAIAVYEDALGRSEPPPVARARAFDTALLLALREKELGLPATPWLDRASALAIEEERPYLEVAAGLPWTTAGAAVDFEPDVRLTGRTYLDSWVSLMGRPDSYLDEYVIVALACTAGTRAAQTDILARIDTTLVPIRYRMGVCGLEHRAHLDEVVAAEPRFVEAQFFIGRYEMTAGVSIGGAPARDWLTRAVPPLLAAHDGIPESPIIAIALAGLMRARTELDRALALYDEAIALRPTQADALLGRTITLTYLERGDDAIATATRMVELGRWHMGQAYYWRAWNHYRAGRLDTAAVDVASARRLNIDADVMTLSGMVAFDQKRPDDARRDLLEALRLDATKCVASWYLGLLDVDVEAWTPAVNRFAVAGACYEQEADAFRAQIDQLPADLPDEARARQVASFEDTAASSLQQAGRSYFNAAQASMRLQDRPAARRYAESAVRYENVRARAEALLQSLGGG